MKNATRILTTLAACLATFAITAPAHADHRADNPPGGCPSSESATQAEVDQLAVGMKKVEVFEILGSRGYRDGSSTSDYLVRQWLYCGDGFQSRQGVVFERVSDSRWVVSEIG